MNFSTTGTATLASLARTRQARAKNTRPGNSIRYGQRPVMTRQFGRCSEESVTMDRRMLTLG